MIESKKPGQCGRASLFSGDPGTIVRLRPTSGPDLGHLQALAQFNVRLAELQDNLFGTVSSLLRGSLPANGRWDSLTNSGSRFQEGVNEGWWSFSKEKSPFQHYTFFEELELPDEVSYKIYRGNAEKLFGWAKEN